MGCGDPAPVTGGMLSHFKVICDESRGSKSPVTRTVSRVSRQRPDGRLPAELKADASDDERGACEQGRWGARAGIKGKPAMAGGGVGERGGGGADVPPPTDSIDEVQIYTSNRAMYGYK